MEINPWALRAIRMGQGKTVSHLAASSGIKQSHLSNVEAGRRKASDDVIVALAKNLDVDVRAITGAVAA